MAADGAFGDLRRLADWFAASPQRTSVQIERLTRRLGTTAVPLLGRELRHADPQRRDAAREALAWLATTPARPRVLGELRSVTSDASDDNTKVCALGLLAELGEPSRATFADPPAMRRRSALALAAQLDTPEDLASAADLMVRQLDDAELHQMLEVMIEAAPAAARRLAGELAARLDLAVERRDRIAALVDPHSRLASLGDGARAPRGAVLRPRPAQVTVLVDAAARLVVVASRKVSGERRWRRWAVLIGNSGRIEDCLHEDDAEGDAATLIASLCADGYRVASNEPSHARAVVAAAARLTAADPDRLPSAYYLGRDLLALADAHLGDRSRRDPRVLALGRAVDLLASGDARRAQAMLERCDPHSCDAAETAGALGAALLVQGQHAAAIDPLSRAIAGDPGWPLHHWNLAIALQEVGDTSGCHHALRRFVATSAQPSGLYGDPEQPGRVACAERMLAELERAARLAGTSLGGTPRRRKRPGQP